MFRDLPCCRERRHGAMGERRLFGGAVDAVVRATYPLARDSLQAIAVTEEPAGGVPQPTGAMVVAGEAKSR